MTTSYIVKRWNTITFAKSFKYINLKFDDTELTDQNRIIYIGDSRSETNNDDEYDLIHHSFDILGIVYIIC